MRKLGRILRRLLTTVSVLLFLTILLAWLRGHFHVESYVVIHERLAEDGYRRTALSIDWASGDIGLHWGRFSAGLDDARTSKAPEGARSTTRWVQHARPAWSPQIQPLTRMYAESAQTWGLSGHQYVVRNWMGAVATSTDGRSWIAQWYDYPVLYGRVETRSAAVPCWLAALLCGILPAWRCTSWWCQRRKRRSAAQEGRCTNCGYDLRASPHRCPECGMKTNGQVDPKTSRLGMMLP